MVNLLTMVYAAPIYIIIYRLTLGGGYIAMLYHIYIVVYQCDTIGVLER